MRDRLRTFDSKITFFAFADIITAVSGMLIFITLLLATDLGRPTDNRSQAAAELEKQINETLTRQAELDVENQNLQRALTAANTAPAPEKLQSDISRLRAELAQEKSRHAGLAEQLDASRSTLVTRDKTLGITGVRERIAGDARELQDLAQKETKVREETVALEKQMPGIESKILKYRAREGELWLIPDRTGTTKEPVIAIVSSKGLQMERFNQPKQTENYSIGAFSGFKSYLNRIKPENQYVVFLIRPSGIDLFRDLVEVARDAGFEVGFDPLEENRQIQFTSPPPIDDQTVEQETRRGSSGIRPTLGRPGGAATTYNSGGGGDTSTEGNGGPPSGANSTGGTNLAGGTNLIAGTNVVDETNVTGATNGSAESTVNTTNVPATNSVPPNPPPPPKPKSWWQRLLEWLGIR
ncbi:MAG TPA: hypothetical protein VHC44_02400 [Verrucomicrobiae bacterium]|nr:hypothetical protein [Verrucomicrobiae bacterium]